MTHIKRARLAEIRNHWVGEAGIRKARTYGEPYAAVADLLAEISALHGDLRQLRRELQDARETADAAREYILRADRADREAREGAESLNLYYVHAYGNENGGGPHA